MKVSVKVSGAEAAALNIEKIGVRFSKSVHDEMMKQGFRLETEAKQSPPTPVDTGRLRGSISTNWSGSSMSRGKTENPAQPSDGVGQPDERDKQFAVVVGTSVSYAPYLEFGTWCMEARRFMYFAWFTLKDSIPAAIAEAARREVSHK